MKKLLFGTKQQAEAWALQHDCTIDTHPVIIKLSGFQSEEGAPEDYSGETNALVARDISDNVVSYLAYWE